MRSVSENGPHSLLDRTLQVPNYKILILICCEESGDLICVTGSSLATPLIDTFVRKTPDIDEIRTLAWCVPATSDTKELKKETYHLTCPALGVDKGVFGLCGGTAGFLKFQNIIVEKLSVLKSCQMSVTCKMDKQKSSLKKKKAKKKRQT